MEIHIDLRLDRKNYSEYLDIKMISLSSILVYDVVFIYIFVE